MPTERPDLYLHEQVMLLALRNDKGTIESRAGWYSIALGGAVLAELLLGGRVTISEDKKKLIDVASERRFGDEILDECLAKVAGARRRRSATRWVQAFAGIRRLRHRVAAGLGRRGILKDSEDTVLLLFKRKVYPTVDPTPERKLKEQLRRAIFADSSTVDPRIAVLVSLAHATGLLRVHFAKNDLKGRARRLERLAAGDLIGGATREAVQAAQAAVMVAVMAASTAATSAATH